MGRIRRGMKGSNKPRKRVYDVPAVGIADAAKKKRQMQRQGFKDVKIIDDYGYTFVRGVKETVS